MFSFFKRPKFKKGALVLLGNGLYMKINRRRKIFSQETKTWVQVYDGVILKVENEKEICYLTTIERISEDKVQVVPGLG